MAKRIKTVELYEVFGETVEDGGKWQLLCTKHFKICQFTNKKVAASFQKEPEMFCGFCQDDSDFCYTCEKGVFQWDMLQDGTALGHEGHELGGRN